MPQYLVAGRFAEQCERGPQRYSPHRRGGAKSFVDDLVLGRGVVLSRAATTLRSIETQPFDRQICPRKTDAHLTTHLLLTRSLCFDKTQIGQRKRIELLARACVVHITCACDPRLLVFSVVAASVLSSSEALLLRLARIGVLS